MKLKLLMFAGALSWLAGCSVDNPDVSGQETQTAEPESIELVVYSERKEPLIQPFFERFTAETGIRVSWRNDSASALIERMSAEGENSPADVFIAVDAGNLYQATQANLLQPIKSELLETSVPANRRDPDGYWYGLTERARTLVYSTERVKPEQLSSYESMAERNWKGKFCLRSSSKVYNQSLIATMIERLGEAETEEVVNGWVANLATDSFADDTLLAKAIDSGQCDVGLINTYYLGRLLSTDPQTKVAVFWPNQNDGGVHVNITGAGISKHSRHPQQAQQLIEWLVSEQTQAEFAAINFEYPIRGDVALDPIVASWGEFKAEQVDVRVAGSRQAEAVKLMNRAGWR